MHPSQSMRATSNFAPTRRSSSRKSQLGNDCLRPCTLARACDVCIEYPRVSPASTPPNFSGTSLTVAPPTRWKEQP